MAAEVRVRVLANEGRASGTIPLEGTPTVRESSSATCLEEDIAYEPTDMQGSSPTEEVDALACQRRCLETQGCYHFTFWKVYGHCHLQDAFAVRREGRDNFVSGPFKCWDEIKGSGLTRIKNGNGLSFLPKKFEGMEVGSSWLPAMQLPRRFQGTETDMIMQCQAYCKLTQTCAHFTLEVNSRTCHLATSSATYVSGVLNSISGPPTRKAQPEMFMQKKWADGRSEWWQGIETSAIVLVAAGIVFAGVAASVLHFFRGVRQQGDRRALIVAESQDME